MISLEDPSNTKFQIILIIINIIIYNIQKNIIQINELKDLNDIIQTNLKTSFD